MEAQLFSWRAMYTNATWIFMTSWSFLRKKTNQTPFLNSHTTVLKMSLFVLPSPMRPDTDSDPASQQARNLNMGPYRSFKLCDALRWYLILTEINNIQMPNLLKHSENPIACLKCCLGQPEILKPLLRFHSYNHHNFTSLLTREELQAVLPKGPGQIDG